MARELLDPWRRAALGEVTEERSHRVGEREIDPIVLSCTKHYGLVPSDEYFKGRTIYSDDLSNYKIVQRDWFAYATNHLPEGSIGLQDQFLEACVSPIYTVFSVADGVLPTFLQRVLKHWSMVDQYKVHEQATVDRRGSIRYRDFSKIAIDLPPLPEQRQIAEILDTIDEAIRKTEEIIAKLEQVKQGLLHDLLTRGIDENGELRDPVRHPEQFKDSPIGRMPQSWHFGYLEDYLESSVDGPFGSNLKSDHYVDEPGVRVVRLQNIGEGEFLDHEKAWVSEAHASFLARHNVRSGDVLVACLGDSTHLYARSCLYPETHDPGIVKADCFRLRTRPELVPGFLSHVLNNHYWRKDLAGLAHRSGISRDRINLGKLRKIRIPLPSVDEQRSIVDNVQLATSQIREEGARVSKLQILKKGLMDDLLTGKVRVTPLLDEIESEPEDAKA